MIARIRVWVTIVMIWSTLPCAAQNNDERDKGIATFHIGSLIVYNTYSIGYETFDLLRNQVKHQLRPSVRLGAWSSTFAEKNTGIQNAVGLTYLYGNGNHLLELGSEIVFHYDQGLKGQALVYIGALYRPFVGYRYQPVDKNIVIKGGLGWKELIQVGLGVKL